MPQEFTAAVPILSGGASPVLPSPGQSTGTLRMPGMAKGKKEQAERDKALEDALSRNISSRSGEKPAQGGFGFPFPAGLRFSSCSWEHGQVSARSTRASLSTCGLSPLGSLCSAILSLGPAGTQQSLCKTNEIPACAFLGSRPLLLVSGKGTCPCQALAVPAPKKTSLFCP